MKRFDCEPVQPAGQANSEAELTAASIDGESVIEIPGLMKPWCPAPPDERVRVPLEAKTRLRFYCWVLAPFGLLFLSFALAGVVHLTRSHQSWFGMAKDAGATVLAAVVGAHFFGCFVTLIYDRLRMRPVTIDALGIIDRRSMKSGVLWSDVVEVRRILGRFVSVIGVRLTLRQPLEVRANPFRAGTPPSSCWRRPNQIFVPFVCMDVPEHLLDRLISTLATRAGAKLT